VVKGAKQRKMGVIPNQESETRDGMNNKAAPSMRVIPKKGPLHCYIPHLVIATSAFDSLPKKGLL
jgi:hypothetical protein